MRESILAKVCGDGAPASETSKSFVACPAIDSGRISRVRVPSSNCGVTGQLFAQNFRAHTLEYQRGRESSGSRCSITCRNPSISSKKALN